MFTQSWNVFTQTLTGKKSLDQLFSKTALRAAWTRMPSEKLFSLTLQFQIIVPPSAY